MYLESREEGAPNTRNDFICIEKMERAQRMCMDVRKMCKKFEGSLVMGMHWVM